MLRGAALLTALSCVLLAFLVADGVQAGSATTASNPDWFNITNTTLITVPDVRIRIYVWERNEPKTAVVHKKFIYHDATLCSEPRVVKIIVCGPDRKIPLYA